MVSRVWLLVLFLAHLQAHIVRGTNHARSGAPRASSTDVFVLLVLDPNWQLCYDNVAIDTWAQKGVLAWVGGLRDALTVGPHNPDGDFLEIRKSSAPTEHKRPEVTTYRDLIEHVLASGNSTVALPSMLLLLYQLTQVSTELDRGVGDEQTLPMRLSQLKVTSPASFWPVVELTADMGTPTAPLLSNFSEAERAAHRYPTVDHDAYLPDPSELHKPSLPDPDRAVSVYELPSMEGTVVILPQIVPALLNHGRRYPLTERYGDPFMWTLSTMRNMLRRFLHASGATCLPSLHEYTQLPDKMHLQRAYEANHAQDPANRVSPIPTVEVRAPGNPREQELLCYSDYQYVPSEAYIDATMRAIFEGLLQLESSLPADSNIRKVQAHSTLLGPGHKVVVKNVSGNIQIIRGDRDVRHLHPGASAEGTMDHFGEYDTHPGYIKSREHDSKDEELRHYILKRSLSNAAAHVLTLRVPTWMTRSGCLLEDPASSWGVPCAFGDSKPWRAGPIMASTPELSSGAVTTPMYLRKAAETMARESCGESWLLQPKILDMERLEYRVHVLGEANASGGYYDTMVYYEAGDVAEAEAGQRRRALDSITCMSLMLNSFVVHLLGGADATGGFNDTVVYYVAGDVEHEAKAGQRRRALGCVAYMTLLPDHFWSDSLHAPEQGQDREGDSGYGGGECLSSGDPHEFSDPEKPSRARLFTSAAAEELQEGGNDINRTQWYSPDLYRTIVQAALENVHAVAASLEGPSTTKHLFARADVVLAWYKDDFGTHTVPLINEMSLLNSASKLIDLWEGPAESERYSQWLAEEQKQRKAQLSVEERIASGWGRTIAKLLLQEIASARMELSMRNDHC